MVSTSAYSETTVKKGATSQLVEVYIMHSTTGAGLTGLVYNAAGLTCYYYRSGAASAVSISLATMTLGTWATGGFIVVDGTNMKVIIDTFTVGGVIGAGTIAPIATPNTFNCGIYNP